MHVRSLLVLPSLLTVALAGPAVAWPSYGVYVDSTCTANEWEPPQPFDPSGGDPSDPSQANCALCHTNAQNPDSGLTTAGMNFRASSYSDVSPFCVAVANHPPHFVYVGPQDLAVGVPFVLNVSATDIEGEMMMLTVANAPAGATFTDQGNGQGQFLWTPGEGDVGTRTVTFHAADTGTPMAVGSLDVAMTVVGDKVNHPPVLAPIGNQSVTVGNQLVLALSATEVDGDALTFAALGMPANASLVGTAFSFTPDASQVGNQTVTFTVTDNGTPPMGDSEGITITVGDVNHPPVLAPIGNRSTVVGTPMQIALSATDPDANAIALSCVGLPGGASLTDMQNGTGVIDWNPSAAGSSLVTCTATDNGVPPLAAGSMFTMTATPPPPSVGPTPVIDQARWTARDGRLLISGHWDGGKGGVPPIFGLAHHGGPFPLGTGMSFARSGRFWMEMGPFVAPCDVAAGVNGVPGSAIAVTGAPQDCGETWLAHARAELDCSGVLHVEGFRGPVGGAVVLVDAKTGADLARVQVRKRWGGFRFKGNVGAPQQLQLRAEIGGMSWLLAEPVSVRRAECRWHDRSDTHGDRGGRR